MAHGFVLRPPEARSDEMPVGVRLVRADRLALVGRDGCSYGVGRYFPSLRCGSLGESLGYAEDGRTGPIGQDIHS